MTSTVLARKYRPLSFEAMVGQGHVVQALSNALTQGRLHHAYLFTGTRGVGKTTVSRILAKSLNCVGVDGHGGITNQPCGRCQPCRDIDAGRFVDYVEMDAASNRGVEEISQLLDQAVYKPVVGRFKVYMIDEVHMLSNTAFNAMLKTLEEPPDYLKFVLATTDPQKVPVTVLSRCLQFNLRPMGLQTVQEHLEQVLRQESVEFDPGALRLLARAARGSMRDGLSLTDQAIAFGGGRLDEGAVRQMLGSVDRQHVERLLHAVVAGQGAELVAAVDDLRRQGLSAHGTLDDLASALQDIAVLQAVPALADGDPDRGRWLPLAGQLAADECQLFYSLALHGRGELSLAPDEYAGLLMILLRWLAFKPAAEAGGAHHPKSEGPAPQGVAGPGPVTGAASTGTGAGAGTSGAQASRPVMGDDTPAQGDSPVARLEQGPGSARPPQAGQAAPPQAAPRQNGQAHAAPPPLQPQVVPSTPAGRQSTKASAQPSSAPPRSAVQDDGTATVNDPRPEPPPWEDEPPAAEAEAWLDEAPPPPSPAGRPVAVADPVRAAAASPAMAATNAPPAGAITPRTAPPPAIALVRTPLGDRWNDIVARLIQEGLINALVRELAMQAECVAVEDEPGQSRWRLRVERETLRTEMQRERLAGALHKLLGGEVVLELEAGVARDTPWLRDQALRASRQAAAEALVQQDPLVNTLLSQFPGARVVPGSITPF